MTLVVLPQVQLCMCTHTCPPTKPWASFLALPVPLWKGSQQSFSTGVLLDYIQDDCSFIKAVVCFARYLAALAKWQEYPLTFPEVP